jgi:HTH-type transcriptional regulator, competence development regulator
VQTFGRRLRELRRAKNLDQRGLAALVGVNFTYLSRIENERLDFAPYPSEELILKLATALGADAYELLILAKKVPPAIRERVFERPDVFRKLAGLDDDALDRLMALAEAGTPRQRRKPAADG